MDTPAPTALAKEGKAAKPSMHQASAQSEGSRDDFAFQRPSTGALPQDEEYKIELSAPQEEKLKQYYEAGAANSVIGQVHGRNPGIKGLQVWCRDNLHQSLVEISMHRRGFFELEFAAPEGRQATLGQNYQGIDGLEISFSPWIPHFSPESSEDTRALLHPIWMQLMGLNRFL